MTEVGQMWIGKELARSGQSRREEGAVDLGVTTIGGASAAAETRGEERDLPVFGPGGYCWQPQAGETVLVLKGGAGGEERCIAAADPGAVPADFQPGDVCIRAGETRLYLHADGSVELAGAVNVAGSLSVNGTPVALISDLMGPSAM